MKTITTKKAQVTAFIIIGIILLLLIGMFYYLQRTYLTAQFPEEELPEEIKPIKLAVESCLSAVLDDAVTFVGLRGGYYTMEVEAVEQVHENDPLILKYPYYYVNKELKIPSENELKQGFEEYIEQYGLLCFKDLTQFSTNLRLQDAFAPLQAKIEFNPDGIRADISVPVKIYTGESVTSVNQFSAEVSTHFYRAYTGAKEIARTQVEKYPFFCLDCLNVTNYLAGRKEGQQGEMQERIQEGMQGEIQIIEVNVNPKIILFYILYLDEDKQRIYSFAGKYTESKKTRIKPYPIEDQEITIGFPFEIFIQTNKADFFLDVNLPWLHVNETTNSISFTPDRSHVGEHIVEVTVQDTEGNRDKLYFTVTVKDLAVLPQIKYMGYQNARIGEAFNFQVLIENRDDVEKVYFADDSPLFDINPTTGQISFTPKHDNQGAHTIAITAITSEGSSTTENLHMVISQ